MARWALTKAGVEEWLLETINTLYKGAEAAVRTADGITDWFKVLVGLHQGSGSLGKVQGFEYSVCKGRHY